MNKKSSPRLLPGTAEKTFLTIRTEFALTPNFEVIRNYWFSLSCPKVAEIESLFGTRLVRSLFSILPAGEIPKISSGLTYLIALYRPLTRALTLAFLNALSDLPLPSSAYAALSKSALSVG